MIEVIPAILPKNTDDLESKVLEVKNAEIVHLDVLEKDIWSEIDIPFEVHLMVNNPEKIFDFWVKRRAKRIVVHHLTEKILSERHIVEVGLGVEMNVPIESIFSLVPKVDFIHLMSIKNIGAQGRKLESEIFDRIRLLKSEFPEVIIAVDGGINLNNADELVDVGADRLIIGSAIFGDEDPNQAFKEFLNLVN